MTTLTELREAREACGEFDISTAQIAKPNEWVECPACGGEGGVDAETYVNIDALPLTVQFYGIGKHFGAYNAFVALAFNHWLPLLDRLERAEKALAEIAALDITDAQFVSQGPGLAFRRLRAAVDIARELPALTEPTP